MRAAQLTHPGGAEGRSRTSPRSCSCGLRLPASVPRYVAAAHNVIIAARLPITQGQNSSLHRRRRRRALQLGSLLVLDAPRRQPITPPSAAPERKISVMAITKTQLSVGSCLFKIYSPLLLPQLLAVAVHQVAAVSDVWVPHLRSGACHGRFSPYRLPSDRLPFHLSV